MVWLPAVLWVMLPEQVLAADEEPPRLEVSFHREIWRENPMVQVYAGDDRGLKRLEFCWQETNGTSGRYAMELEGKEYRGSVTLPVETDGWPLSVTAMIYDEAGNRMNWEGQVYVDRQPPEGEIALAAGESRGYYAEGQLVTFLVSEEHMNGTEPKGEVFLDEGFVERAAFSREGNCWRAVVNCMEEGRYRIRGETVDLAGNVWQEELSFVVDQTAPEIQVAGYEEYYLEACSWQVAVSDPWLDGETLSAVLKTPSGAEVLAWSGEMVFWNDEQKREDGWYELRVTAGDLAGNMGEMKKSFCLHRRGSVFSLKEKELIEENQLPIVDETIWEFTECGLKMLDQDKDYVIQEEMGRRIYHFLGEDGIAYQILTKDASGKVNLPSEVLSLAREKPDGLEMETAQRSWEKILIPGAVFVLSFMGAIWIGRKKKGR